MASAGKRLVSAHVVDEHEKQLRAAVHKALEAQIATVNAALRHHGLTGNLTAAAKKKPKKGALAAGAIVVPFAWSQANWNKQVADYVTPVAKSVVAATIATAAGAFGTAAATWGMDQDGAALTTLVTSRATTTGAWIGDRVNEAAIGDDVETDVGAVIGTADDILGNILGALSQAIGNMASQDVANYVISYNAPTYLSATKTWNTQEDDRVRPDHEDADGQEVAINDTFQVGGEDMTGPGDPSASDEQTINCRCWLTYSGMVPEGTEDQFQNEIPPDPNVNMEDGPH